MLLDDELHTSDHLSCPACTLSINRALIGSAKFDLPVSNQLSPFEGLFAVSIEQPMAQGV